MRPWYEGSRVGPVAHRLLQWAPVLAISASVMSACVASSSDPFALRYQLDLAGVVVDRQVTQEPFEFELAGGKRVAIDQNRQPFIDNVGPIIGDLLLTGTQPSPWAASVGTKGVGEPPICFAMDNAAFDAGDWIEVEIRVQGSKGYLHLPKADNWEGRGEKLGEALTGFGVCLNEQGEVFSEYGSAGF